MDLLRKYLPYVEGALTGQGVKLGDILALGRVEAAAADEPFNMAFLAQRGSAMSVGVSRLHGEVSREIFQPLFPRWPSCEVPVAHITNGVHVPTWDSQDADRLWTQTCGKERWRTPPGTPCARIVDVSDEDLWAMRGDGRQRVVRVAREHLATQLSERGFDQDTTRIAETVLDPNVLTIGFARRFTEYKRPNLLLTDRERLGRLLLNEKQPVQIVVAGKAHPADLMGKTMIQQWVAFAQQPAYRRRLVFIEDYDIDLAQELVQGVDVWINTPRRPWEACGTSGMKVLVNGGLNCSIRDGWWDEAFEPDVGWSIGDGLGGRVSEVDARDAASLYEILESKVVPEFYDRDAEGVPRAWLQRIRNSMLKLTPVFGTARMMRDYVEMLYLPLARAMKVRPKDNFAAARDMNRWSRTLHSHWPGLQIEPPTIAAHGRDPAIRGVGVPGRYLADGRPGGTVRRRQGGSAARDRGSPAGPRDSRSDQRLCLCRVRDDFAAGRRLHGTGGGASRRRVPADRTAADRLAAVGTIRPTDGWGAIRRGGCDMGGRGITEYRHSPRSETERRCSPSSSSLARNQFMRSQPAGQPSCNQISKLRWRMASSGITAVASAYLRVPDSQRAACFRSSASVRETPGRSPAGMPVVS
ncbi:MAG: alpha-glucan family phosphorylase [Rhizomicrobium sp.]